MKRTTSLSLPLKFDKHFYKKFIFRKATINKGLMSKLQTFFFIKKKNQKKQQTSKQLTSTVEPKRTQVT